VALILGMVGCLAIFTVLPVTSQARRSQSWRHAIGSVLPGVARKQIVPRRGAREIVAGLTSLLPRLAPVHQREEEFLRGALSAASMAVELGRLADLGSDPAMPPAAGAALERFLERFAGVLESLAASRDDDRQARVAQAEGLVAEMRATLSALALEPGMAARALLRAGASLRFIADRFALDRAYLEYSFAQD
jgi:hypothetical protein